MKLSLAFLAAAAPALVSGKRLAKNISPDMDLSNVEIKAQSKTGNKLLSKARRLDDGDATTWVAGYSLKFHSCTSSQDYYGGQFENDEDGYNANYQYNDGNYNQDGNNNNNNNADYNGNYQNGNGYYNNEQRNDYQGMYQQKLVHFKLCPSDSCFRCKNGADYVVDLNTFADAILEAQMTQQEYACENVKENCYCDNANSEEQCLYNCYQNAELTDCVDAMYEDEFDVQEAIECVQLEVDEEAVNNYYFNTRAANQGQYYNGQDGDQQGEVGEIYVGPYCSKNGKNIFLGTFMEETCSYPAPAGIYEALHYGDSLPYSKKSLVPSGCTSCMVPKEIEYNQNYNQNQQEANEVTEVCAALYESSGKCEEGLDGYFPYRDISACSYIKTLKSTGMSMPSANIPAKVFAGIFGVTTAILAGVAVVLAKRNRRQNVSLAGNPIIS